MTEPYYQDETVTLYHGDALATLREMPDASVDCCVTSPPYFGLRDYGVDGQYGLESSPVEYVETMRVLFAEVRRVIAGDGTLWLNIGDSFASNGGAGGRMASNLGTAVLERPEARDPEKFGRWNKHWGVPAKNLLGVPWRTALALQDDGWILRNDIIWAKPNAMPESVTDRLSTRHEHMFLFSKSPRYWFDLDPIREPLAKPDAPDGEWVFGGKNKVVGADPIMRRRGNTYTVNPDSPGRNPGDVWSIPTQPFPDAHFAAMPITLAERCVMAGCKPGGTALDPFSGSGSTGLAATKHGRRYIGVDLNADYLDLSLRTRLAQSTLDFTEDAS